MKYQSVKAQQGEIAFRKKLVQQHIEGQNIFHDEFNGAGIEKILAERMKKTLHQMTGLKERGLTISTYIEIGAERCQRALIMENDLGGTGAVLDISYEMLKSCDYYQPKFGKIRSLLRICCDIHRLPIMSNSIPFVFCYETLHRTVAPEYV